MTIDSFAPISTETVTASTTSQQVTVPGGSPDAVLITNMSDPSGQAVFVALGDDTVEATYSTATPVLAGRQVAFTVGGNTTVALVTRAGVTGVNVSFGS